MAMRRTAVILAGGIAIVLGVASTAWACFVAGTAPYLSATPHQAAPGARVTVTGGNWVAGANPVAIRWGSANGAVLTYGQPNPDTRGGFSAIFTVPDEDGPRLVYAVQPGSETQATVIDVTRPAPTTDTGGQTPATEPSNTAVSTTGGARTPAAAPAPTEAPSVAAAPAGSPVSTVAPAVASMPAVTDTAATPSPAAGAVMTPGASGRSPVPTTTATLAPAARPGAALRTLLPSAPAVALGTADEEQAQQPVPLAMPSLRSASGDVWSGLERAGAPGLTNLPGGVTGSSSEANEGLIGLGLLVAGTVALSAGFAVAELRRRKAQVAGCVIS